MALIACLCLYREHILASGKEGTASNPQNPDTSRPQFLSKRIDVKTRKSRAAVTTTTTSMTTLTPNVPRPGGSPGTAPAAPPEIPPWLQQDEDESKEMECRQVSAGIERNGRKRARPKAPMAA